MGEGESAGVFHVEPGSAPLAGPCVRLRRRQPWLSANVQPEYKGVGALRRPGDVGQTVP